jgi:hypothetical protein
VLSDSRQPIRGVEYNQLPQTTSTMCRIHLTCTPTRNQLHHHYYTSAASADCWMWDNGRNMSETPARDVWTGSSTVPRFRFHRCRLRASSTALTPSHAEKHDFVTMQKEYETKSPICIGERLTSPVFQTPWEGPCAGSRTWDRRD